MIHSFAKAVYVSLGAFAIGAGLPMYISYNVPEPCVHIKHTKDAFDIELCNNGGTMRINHIEYVKNVKNTMNTNMIAYDHFKTDYSAMKEINDSFVTCDTPYYVLPREGQVNIVSFRPKTDKARDHKNKVLDDVEKNRVYVSYSYFKVPILGFLCYRWKMLELS